MRNYNELVEALRKCSYDDHFDCPICKKNNLDCSGCNPGAEAADAIEELVARDVVPMDFHERCLQLEIKKRIELEKQMPRWISVEERLPEPESMVLVATKHDGVYYGFLNHSGKIYTSNNTLYDSWCWEPDATHWMPLPAPPKGVE